MTCCSVQDIGLRHLRLNKRRDVDLWMRGAHSQARLSSITIDMEFMTLPSPATLGRPMPYVTAYIQVSTTPWTLFHG